MQLNLIDLRRDRPMKCSVVDSGQPDSRGWRPVKCKRCQRQYGLTPHPPERFNARCRVLPFFWEFGHWLTLLLGIFGISKSGVNWIRYRLGLKKPCGCDKREAALNTIGERFRSLVRLAVSRARSPRPE